MECAKSRVCLGRALQSYNLKRRRNHSLALANVNITTTSQTNITFKEILVNCEHIGTGYFII